MKLELESQNKAIVMPEPADLARGEHEEFMVLSSSSDMFMQCAHDKDDGSWVLEYRAGSAGHYAAVGALDWPRIHAAFVKYLADDPSYRDDFAWEPA